MITRAQYGLLINHLRPRIVMGELLWGCDESWWGEPWPSFGKLFRAVAEVITILEAGGYPDTATIQAMFPKFFLYNNHLVDPVRFVENAKAHLEVRHILQCGWLGGQQHRPNDDL